MITDDLIKKGIAAQREYFLKHKKLMGRYALAKELGITDRQAYVIVEIANYLITEKPVEENKKSEIKDKGNIKEVSGTFSDLDDLILKCKIDTEIWECYDFHVTDGEWEVASKYRDQNLTWTKGMNNKGEDIQIMEGHAIRKNEFIKTTNKKFQISAKFRLKATIIYKDTFKDELIKDFKALAKKQKTTYQPFNINKNETTFALEVNRFDLHYGKLVWGEETGGSHYDTKIAKELYEEAGAYLLNEARRICKIDRIFLPVGQDFFNSDNSMPFPSTTKGTPQQEDLRWQKTFRNGRVLVAEDIVKFSEVAPVKVVIIPGNHDFQKSFFLGDALECLFQGNPNVQIDNSANPIKYLSYGTVLLGYVHDAGSVQRLSTTMQYDVPDLWMNSKFREWHIGHIHHSKKLEIMTEEDKQSITIRYLRTMMPTEGWENEQQYRSMKGAEAFIWSKTNGLFHMIPFNL